MITTSPTYYNDYVIIRHYSDLLFQVLEEAQQLAVEKYNVKDKSNLWVGEYLKT